MTAAYRLKGFGWFIGLAAVALGFYLVSLQVAAERKKLDDVTQRIALAKRDIRALETEFDTRANLRQLEQWNGDTLALAAPTAAQFVRDDATLAALDPRHGPNAGEVRTAALVVPALGSPAPVSPVAPVAPVTPAIAAPAPPPAHVPAPTMQRASLTIATEPHAAPAVMRLAGAKVRPQAVALLDRQLLSDTTFGDIASGARREARR